MFKLLVEMETTHAQGEYTTSAGETKTRTEHTPDIELSNTNPRTQGVKKINITKNMSTEDEKAFKNLQKNVKRFKQELIDDGQGEIAQQIPDDIATPPEFILGFHAYTFKKEPDTLADLFRVRGAMSAIKSRNPDHYMTPDEIKKVVNAAADRLSTNIRDLLKHEHVKMARNANSSSELISNFAVTSTYFWYNKFIPGTVQFPTGTVLVPLGSSSGLVGDFANALSNKTGTPIIHDAFKKSNNPLVSSTTKVADSEPELRMGTEVYSALQKSKYSSSAIDSLKTKTENFLTTIKMKSTTMVNTTNVKNAIARLPIDTQNELANKLKEGVAADVSSHSSADILESYYKFLMKKIRIALTEDYNYYTDIIEGQFDTLLSIKLSGNQKTEANKKKRIEIINDIREARSALKSMPKPDVSMGGSSEDLTMAGLKSLLEKVRNYINAIDITKDDYANDAKIEKVMDDIKKARAEVPIDEMQRLYKLNKAKLFKFSGARPKSGGDAGKAFSRFQLANVNTAKQLDGKHVIIIDDNISTGGTVRDAVVSLYVNGINPLSIIVATPHYLSGTAAKFDPYKEELVDGRPMTRDEWEQKRNEIKASIDAGDDAYRASVIGEIEKDINLNEPDAKKHAAAVKRLADLAISITNDQSPFISVLLAQKIFLGDINFEKYVDFVVHLGMMKNEYGQWYNEYQTEIATVRSRARRPLTAQEAADLEEIAKTRGVWRKERKQIVGHAKDAALAVKAPVEKPVELSTTDRIKAYQEKLSTTPEKFKPAIQTFIVYLRNIEKIEKKNIFVPGLTDIKKDIESTIRANKLDDANAKINQLIVKMNKK